MPSLPGKMGIFDPTARQPFDRQTADLINTGAWLTLVSVKVQLTGTLLCLAKIAARLAELNDIRRLWLALSEECRTNQRGTGDHERFFRQGHRLIDPRPD